MNVSRKLNKRTLSNSLFEAGITLISKPNMDGWHMIEKLQTSRTHELNFESPKAHLPTQLSNI